MIAPSRIHWVVPIIAVAAMMAARPVHAESRNQIRAITFTEDAGTTRVKIAGSEEAIFTVYKLERPSRVVLDIARAELASELRGHEAGVSLAANTWAVGSVGAQPLADGGSGVRVIVALARPGRYDVKIEGKSLVVVITARDAAPQTVTSAEAARVHAEADAARRDSQAAKAEAARLRAEKDNAAAQAATATRQQVEIRRALAAAEQAKAAAEAARVGAEREAAQARSGAQEAQREAARLREVAAAQAERAARAERQAAQQQQDRKRDEAAAKAAADARLASERATAEADRARKVAAAAAAEAERTRAAAVEAQRKSQAELEQARRDIAKAQAQLQSERVALEADRRSVSARQAELERARGEAEASRQRAESSRAQTEAAQQAIAQARAENEAAKRAVAEARAENEAAKRAVAQARTEVERLRAVAQAKLADANTKLATANARMAELDSQTASARKLQEDAQHAARQAGEREASARRAAADAAAQQAVARAEAKRAAEARDRASRASADQATSRARAERERLVAEAKEAEARLQEVNRAAAAAVAQRREAERAAGAANRALAEQRSALASLESQRRDTESKIRDAATRQAQAETAAARASARRQQAETEARTADEQRLAAEQAARRAEEQREAAEVAKRTADEQRRAAEAGLAELVQRRKELEQAQTEVAERRAAADKAQATADAVAARQASAAQRARAQAEAKELDQARRRAEAELRERTQAVAAQAKEVDRLKAVASQARRDAEREANRRAQLVEQRVAEEQELARLRRQAKATPASADPAEGGAALNLVAAPGKASKPSPAPASKPRPAARTAASAAPAGAVTDIAFHGDDEPRVDISLRGAARVQRGPVSSRRAELIIDDAALAKGLERKLDVTRFGGAIRSISSFQDRKVPGRVRVVVELSAPATPTVQRRGDVVGWTFAPATSVAKRPRTQNIPPPVIGGFGAASAPVAQQTVTQVNRRRKVYRGPTVELDFKEAPIHDLLRLLSDVGKVNIVVPDEVDAKVTVRMKRVPWDQALEVILASKGLWYRQEGNLIRVAQRKALDEEDEAEAARRAAAVQAEAPRPDVLTLNYASADDLRNKLQPLLSPKGKIEVDDRTNALIVNDVRANREEVRALALQLDTQTPQISIEARIVEARSTYTREIGVQWGGRTTAGPDGGNATGLLFPSSISAAGGAEDATTVRSGVPTPSDFAVNLPAAVGSGAGGALGLSLGSIGGNTNINLRLSALEGTGSVRIISAPKITVLNNTEAKISQGVSVPIQVLSAQGTNTVFVPADLSLTVKPYVSLRDCAIAMELNVTKNEPDFVNTGARGDPSILRKEARTTLLVNDGETSVLGGIYTRNAGLSYAKVPFFGDLPVLGWFFKNRKENDTRTEVLVFITPKITNKAFLRCQPDVK
ncbi:MAG: type IV pilus secretin PilQ [Kofleriaceae bacterium]